MLILSKAFFRTLGWMAKKSFRRLAWRCVFLTLVLLLAFVVLVGWGLAALSLWGGWAEVIADALAFGGATLLAWFLFPVLLPVVASLFSEKVADLIIRRHYPEVINELKRPGPGLWSETVFAAKALGLNGCALLLLPFPPLYVAVYWLLNGWLLGQEFFRLVVLRHERPEGCKKLLAEGRGRIFLAGLALAGAAATPVLNLFLPLIAPAFMTHLYQQSRGAA